MAPLLEPVSAPIPAVKSARVAALDPPPRQQRPANARAAAGVQQVGGQGVTVRSGPSKASPRLFALEAGQQVTVTANQKGWLQITDARGRQGWAYSDFLSKP